MAGNPGCRTVDVPARGGMVGAMTDESNSAQMQQVPAGQGLLDWLFLDFNSYFASVELQENPELRGKPVIVIPAATESTCAIAASPEAKSFKIKTGTSIKEAREKCPRIVCVLARPDVYSDYHRRILKEIDRHVPLHKFESIDEMSCRLIGSMREPANALAAARRLKEGIRRNIGECLRCSIGLSTNRFLAKVATDLEKRDGLVILRASDLPGRLAGMKLEDLPGIGRNMRERLVLAGIQDIPGLWRAPAKQLRQIWGGVEGERFYCRLHGIEVDVPENDKSSVSHGRVLDADSRLVDQAELFARRLALKAASRLRLLKQVATVISIHAWMEDDSGVEEHLRLQPTNDSVEILHRFSQVWQPVRERVGYRRIRQIGVTLHGLMAESQPKQLDLFSKPDGLSAEERTRRQRLSEAMDAINRKLGPDSITLGVLPQVGGFFAGSKIAFNRVPLEEEFLRDGRKELSKAQIFYGPVSKAPELSMDAQVRRAERQARLKKTRRIA